MERYFCNGKKDFCEDSTGCTKCNHKNGDGGFWENDVKNVFAYYFGDYDFDRLRELAEADRDGRCVVLPVEVGQNVYFINQPLDSEICTAIVIGAEINLYTPSCPIWLEIEWFSPTLGKHKYHSRADLMIGKTVFLTHEEAEEALQEMSEQDE